MYSLEIPPELVKEMFFIRERTKASIRSQIINAVKKHIEAYHQASKLRLEEPSLLQAIEANDEKLTNELMSKAERGEMIRIL